MCNMLCTSIVFDSSIHFFFINNKVEEKKFFLRRKEIIFIGHNYVNVLQCFIIISQGGTKTSLKFIE